MNSRKRPMLRPTALVLSLLAAAAFIPAHAGQVCDLANGDPATEDTGGTTAIGVAAVACGSMNTADGQQAAAFGAANAATGFPQATSMGRRRSPWATNV